MSYFCFKNIENIKNVKSDVEKRGNGKFCPFPLCNIIPNIGCSLCEKEFAIVAEKGGCPCNHHYSKGRLLEALDKWISLADLYPIGVS